jgi:hypothetical protein
VVKGKYINEEARAAYKEAEKKITPDIEKKSNFTNVKVGLDEIKNDMLKMMDKIDKLESAVRILSNRLNRVDGMGK